MTGTLTASGTGKGRTIVIVDSFGSPIVQHDLGVYGAQFGTPGTKVQVVKRGNVPKWGPKNADMLGWAGEATLDVEMAHAVAPDAKMVLVDAAVAETEGATGLPETTDADKALIDHGVGDVITTTGRRTVRAARRSARYPARPFVRSADDLEGREGFEGFLVDFHSGDRGRGRALVGPGDQVGHRFRGALEGRLDRAVREVADPAGHAVLEGRTAAGVAEEDPLYLAVDDHSAAHPFHGPTIAGQVTGRTDCDRGVTGCRSRESSPGESGGGGSCYILGWFMGWFGRVWAFGVTGRSDVLLDLVEGVWGSAGMVGEFVVRFLVTVHVGSQRGWLRWMFACFHLSGVGRGWPRYSRMFRRLKGCAHHA